MKRNTQLTYTICFCLFMIFSLLIQGCKEDDFEDPGINEDPLAEPVEGDPDKITNDLILTNMSTTTGEMPPITGGGQEFIIDRETIYLAAGHKPYIHISIPEGMVIHSFYAQVDGSETYIDADFENEFDEGLSGIGQVILNLDIDPVNYELPLGFDLTIRPKDDSENPLGEIKVPVVVEKPYENTGNCSIESFLNGQESRSFSWLFTLDPNRVNGGMAMQVAQVTNSTTSGCCTSSGSHYGDCIGNDAYREVPYVIKSFIEYDQLTFYDDGRVEGRLVGHKNQNIDPHNTDYCNGNPAYSITTVSNKYEGTYTVNPIDCTIRIENLTGESEPVDFGGTILDFPKPIHTGYGNSAEFKLISEHNLIEERINPETGEKDEEYRRDYYDDLGDWLKPDELIED